MIDTHCHLDLCADPAAAASNDLEAMISVGTSLDRNRDTIRLAETLPRVYAAVGIHPNDASAASDPATRAAVETLAERPRVVAIGETGFDDYWQDETLERQREAFDWHAALAARLDLPLILHVRDAQGSEAASMAAVEAIAAAGWPKGILHCCNGHERLVATGLELGWMVSCAGNLTYKSADDLRQAAAEVPLERLLVETDSPYLTPEPLRGERNVPQNVHHTARVLAEVRRMDVGELEPMLDANATRVYRLPR
jgi:TatD DNase family protein